MQVVLELVAVTKEQMLALSQFLKQIGPEQCAVNAESDQKVVQIHLAVLALREALENAGYKVT